MYEMRIKMNQSNLSSPIARIISTSIERYTIVIWNYDALLTSYTASSAIWLSRFHSRSYRIYRIYSLMMKIFHVDHNNLLPLLRIFSQQQFHASRQTKTIKHNKCLLNFFFQRIFRIKSLNLIDFFHVPLDLYFIGLGNK